MIEIFEINDKEHINDLSKNFKLDVSAADRVFVMRENGDIGAGVLGLEKGTVVIKTIFVKDGLPFAYYDLLTRSLLGIIRDFSPIKVRINKRDKYFEGFGFTGAAEGMEIISDKINLIGQCRAKRS